MKGIIKYTDIIRYGKSNTIDVLKKGDYITITEKIDGANASFTRDDDNMDGTSCYSRNQLLDNNQGLRGFGDWVKKNIAPQSFKLPYSLIFYGEWLVQHKVHYKPEYYGQFYLFSIYDTDKSEYLTDENVKDFAKMLNLKTPEYFYEGEFISFEHLMSFVGRSNMTLTPDTGEGIVVKNVNYRDSYGNQCFVKLVSEKFAEVQKQRLPKNPIIDDENFEKLKSIIAEARIDKMIHKLVDEEILREDYSLEDMKLILSHMGSRILDDIKKEEPEIIENIEDKVLGKYIAKIAPPIVRKLVNKH